MKLPGIPNGRQFAIALAVCLFGAFSVFWLLRHHSIAKSRASRRVASGVPVMQMRWRGGTVDVVEGTVSLTFREHIDAGRQRKILAESGLAVTERMGARIRVCHTATPTGDPRRFADTLEKLALMREFDQVMVHSATADVWYVLRDFGGIPQQEITWKGRRTPVVQGEILVQFTTTPTPGIVYDLCIRYSMWVERVDPGGFHVFRVKDPRELENALSKMAGEPGIASCSPNPLMYTHQPGSDQ